MQVWTSFALKSALNAFKKVYNSLVHAWVLAIIYMYNSVGRRIGRQNYMLLQNNGHICDQIKKIG